MPRRDLPVPFLDAAGQPVVVLAETVWTPPVSRFTTCSTRLLGVANPTPMLPEDCPSTLALAVVMPTTCPAALTREANSQERSSRGQAPTR